MVLSDVSTTVVQQGVGWLIVVAAAVLFGWRAARKLTRLVEELFHRIENVNDAVNGHHAKGRPTLADNVDLISTQVGLLSTRILGMEVKLDDMDEQLQAHLIEEVGEGGQYDRLSIQIAALHTEVAVAATWILGWQDSEWRSGKDVNGHLEDYRDWREKVAVIEQKVDHLDGRVDAITGDDVDTDTSP